LTVGESIDKATDYIAYHILKVKWIMSRRSVENKYSFGCIPVVIMLLVIPIFNTIIAANNNDLCRNKTLHAFGKIHTLNKIQDSNHTGRITDSKIIIK